MKKDSEEEELTINQKRLFEILRNEKSVYAFNKEVAKYFYKNEYIPYFIKQYLEDNYPKSVLNLWAGFKEAEILLKPLINYQII